MKKTDKEAFLKSVKGVFPIKKNNTLSKPIPKENITKKSKILTKTILAETEQKTKENEIKKSYFKIEKTQLNKKLKRGRVPIDKKIDFHGMSVFEAEQTFIKTIKNCYNNNVRCLLFVTGKGVLNKHETKSNKPLLYYGKIRNSFFSWVEKSELQKYILSVEQADIQHGADGAFFVYLRKAKY